uniref:Uncharacterized protein n=1 Tax=Trichogramma kaykai TaxID=54128 RepID=A0ABD2WBD5_9HYME
MPAAALPPVGGGGVRVGGQLPIWRAMMRPSGSDDFEHLIYPLYIVCTYVSYSHSSLRRTSPPHILPPTLAEREVPVYETSRVFQSVTQRASLESTQV